MIGLVGVEKGALSAVRLVVSLVVDNPSIRPGCARKDLWRSHRSRFQGLATTVLGVRSCIRSGHSEPCINSQCYHSPQCYDGSQSKLHQYRHALCVSVPFIYISIYPDRYGPAVDVSCSVCSVAITTDPSQKLRAMVAQTIAFDLS